MAQAMIKETQNEDQKKPTIKDVAKKAEVSVATVSRILNDLPGYSPATKKKVLKVIRQTGYTPNAVARGLVSSKTRTIGVLIPSVNEFFAYELLNGIEKRAHEMNYSVIICNTDSNGRRTMEYLRVLREKQVEGIIFTSEWLTDEYEHTVEEMNIPMVLVSTYSTRYQIPFVRIDDKMASCEAVRYLIRKGHRTIGMISGSISDPIAGKPRVEGYKNALEEAGIPYRDDFIAYGDFHYESGLRCAQTLLGAQPEITAVFVSSDEMAAGVLTWAYRNHIRVPDKLSVVGYDDTQVARMAIPPLTSVHQPLSAMGCRAVELLLSGKKTGEGVVMPFSITERESVRDFL
ncbi:MAG: LacI family DNA-binding transcriptional regulator [Chloroflexota bacterium]